MHPLTTILLTLGLLSLPHPAGSDGPGAHRADHATTHAPAAPVWGQNGHRIVGEIATRHLSEEAAAAVEALIGPIDLAQAGTWADEIRSDSTWDHAAPWHYITIEDDQTLETAPRNPDGDIVEAMERFEAVLRDPKADHEAQAQALKFMVHFVGDVHQPLHVGRGADRGGNGITVYWFGDRTNLHSVWDTRIIENQHLSFTEFTRFIDHATEAQVAAWQRASYADWVAESKALRDFVYDFGPDNEGEETPRLGYGYAYRATPVVRQRLLQAGIRLAGLLNDIFGKG